MPKREREYFTDLVTDLQSTEPIQKNWPNFSALSENTHIIVIYRTNGLRAGEMKRDQSL
jgi:hypothetical protein